MTNDKKLFLVKGFRYDDLYKDAVELTPSLEENITDEIIRNLEKSNDMWRFKEEDLAITAIERVFQKLKESIK